jgi:hypothetical protein
LLPSAILVFLVLVAFTPGSSSLAPSSDCIHHSDLSPPVAEDSDGNMIASTNASKLVIIFSTFSNPCGYDQQALIVTEVRDRNNATAFFQNTIVDAVLFNSSDVGVLWYPKDACTYELRSFAISNSIESQVSTDVQTRELVVVEYELKSA